MGGHELVGKRLQIIVSSGQESSDKLESVLKNIGINMCEYTGMKWLGIITADNMAGKTEREWRGALDMACEAGRSIR